MNGKFLIGEIYYKFSLYLVGARPVPDVSTWSYRGHVRKDYLAETCDSPYHFYEFYRPFTTPDDEYVLIVPSLVQAEEDFLTWDEFVQAASEADLSTFG